jgi:hypothetical protein
MNRLSWRDCCLLQAGLYSLQSVVGLGGVFLAQTCEKVDQMLGFLCPFGHPILALLQSIIKVHLIFL